MNVDLIRESGETNSSFDQAYHASSRLVLSFSATSMQITSSAFLFLVELGNASSSGVKESLEMAHAGLFCVKLIELNKHVRATDISTY